MKNAIQINDIWQSSKSSVSETTHECIYTKWIFNIDLLRNIVSCMK